MTYGAIPVLIGLLAGQLFVGDPGAPLFADPLPPAARLADGTIDLGGDGYWDVPFIDDLALAVPRGVADPSEAAIPFMPWSRELFEYNRANYSKYDPETFCLPPGVAPRAMSTPYPVQFIQQTNPARIVLLYAGGTGIWRVVYMDGRQFPNPGELNPTYQGYSIGRWDGDTLVIETRGYNERSWLDYAGHVHTDQLVTVELIRRRDHLALEYEATIDDPGAYTEPWTRAWTIGFVTGEDPPQWYCQEFPSYLIYLNDDFGNPFFDRTPVVR